MSAEAARRAPMMTLNELVARYRKATSGFGEPVALSAFRLTPAETERVFSTYNEDYHISRFLRFEDSDGQRYSVCGEPATHVSIDAAIGTIL
jgi:hypothetical protein